MVIWKNMMFTVNGLKTLVQTLIMKYGYVIALTTVALALLMLKI